MTGAKSWLLDFDEEYKRFCNSAPVDGSSSDSFLPQIVRKVGFAVTGDGSSRELPNFAGAAAKASSPFLKRTVHFYCRGGGCEVNSQSDCGPDLTQQGVGIRSSSILL